MASCQSSSSMATSEPARKMPPCRADGAMIWNSSATSEASCSRRVINSPVWRPVWKRIDRRCTEWNAVRLRVISQVVDERGVDPSPGEAEPHFRQPRKQNQGYSQQHHAGESSLRGEHFVEQETTGQEWSDHRGAGAAGQRQAEHRQPPVLAARHQRDEARQHAPRVRSCGADGLLRRCGRLLRGPVALCVADSGAVVRRGVCGSGDRLARPQKQVGGIHERFRVGDAYGGIAGQ